MPVENLTLYKNDLKKLAKNNPVMHKKVVKAISIMNKLVKALDKDNKA